MPIRRIRLRNFFFPTADLQPEGGFGDAPYVPDDIGMQLAYPVIQTAVGAKLLRGLSSGGLFVTSNSAPISDVDVQTVTLGTAAQQVVTPRFTPSVLYIVSLNALVSIDITVLGTAQTPRVLCAAGATQYFAIPAVSMLIKNQSPSGTATCTVSAFV